MRLVDKITLQTRTKRRRTTFLYFMWRVLCCCWPKTRQIIRLQEDDTDDAELGSEERASLMLRDILTNPAYEGPNYNSVVCVDSGLEFTLRSRNAFCVGDVVGICEYVTENLGPGYLVVPDITHDQGGLVYASFGGEFCNVVASGPQVTRSAILDERVFAVKAAWFMLDDYECYGLWAAPLLTMDSTYYDVMETWKMLGPENQLFRIRFKNKPLKIRLMLYSNYRAPHWTRNEICMLRNAFIFVGFECHGKVVAERKL